MDSRERWIAVLRKYQSGTEEPGSKCYWAPEYETASRKRIRDIQEEKLAAMLPYLYEHSAFYRARFDAERLKPGDLKSIDALPKFSIITKSQMADDVVAHPPWGTYTPVDERTWSTHGWMVFATSGTTATPRSFRYTDLDRDIWARTSARALYATGLRAGDTLLSCTNYNPHVFFWSLHYACNLMRVTVVPGGVATERRIQMIDLYRPTALAATPSYALHLADWARRMGLDPTASSIKRVICGGEPASGISATRQRIEEAWGARLHDIYGCTEAVPAGWGFTCEPGLEHTPVATHVQEDLQIWETVDPETLDPVAKGSRGLTVVTNLNSEGSPQLRFLVGDFAILDYERCVCGRTLARARSGFAGRADDMLNIRGLKLFPGAIEDIVRSFREFGDEFQIVLDRDGELDTFTIVVESGASAAEGLRTRLVAEVLGKCELRPRVEVVALGTLPKTEFKAQRVIDRRRQP